MSTAYPAYNRDVNPDKQKEAVAAIAKILDEAKKAYDTAVASAEKLADEFDVEMYIETNGVGFTRGPRQPDGDGGWVDSGCSDYYYYGESRGMWLSSSYRC